MLRFITHSFDDGLSGPKLQFALKAGRANDHGEALPADHFPPEIYVSPESDRSYTSLPDLFFAGTYWVASGGMVEVMRRFDMGSAGFYPTVVHRKDRKTPIGDKWFCINFGNQKKAFVWQGSKKVYRLASGYDDVWVPQQPNDGDLVVEAAALEGPAMWIDPAIIDVIFVHGELRDALKAAGVARPFSFKKCKVI